MRINVQGSCPIYSQATTRRKCGRKSHLVAVIHSNRYEVWSDMRQIEEKDLFFLPSSVLTFGLFLYIDGSSITDPFDGRSWTAAVFARQPFISSSFCHRPSQRPALRVYISVYSERSADEEKQKSSHHQLAWALDQLTLVFRNSPCYFCHVDPGISLKCHAIYLWGYKSIRRRRILQPPSAQSNCCIIAIVCAIYNSRHK